MDTLIPIINLALLVVAIAIVIYFVVQFYKNKVISKPGANKQNNTNNAETKESDRKTKKADAEKKVNRDNTLKFLEFERIADDMITQPNGKYSMVLQCKGINYELLSDIEKLSVEEGFVTFLSSLRFPIQLYVQTNTVNLNENLKKYRERLDGFIQELDQQQREFAAKRVRGQDNREVEIMQMELENKANLIDYGQDIIYNVERMSMNKNILQRSYYLIVSYDESDIGLTGNFTKNDIYEICQRELFVRCQTIISGLSSASISAKLLNSNQLAELIFIAYNRDDSELMNIQQSLSSGYYRLYSESEDVFEKKRKIIVEAMEEEAIERARNAFELVASEEDEETLDKAVEENYDQVVDEMALDIVNEFRGELSDEVIDKVASKIINGEIRLEKQETNEEEKPKKEKKEKNKEDETEQQIKQEDNIDNSI